MTRVAHGLYKMQKDYVLLVVITRGVVITRFVRMHTPTGRNLA